MRKRWFLIISVVIIIFFSVKYFNDNREKGLDDVIRYDVSDVESLSIRLTGNHEWRTDQKVHIEALKDFLSNSRVKRMKDHEWDSDVSKEEGFMVSIYSKGEQIPIDATIFEKRVHVFNGGKYYRILNDPIDVDWIKQFIKENEQQGD
ncbi:hypothetical protein [Pontibacillus salipaludis]|uniref:Uncharacterized protein n=1 Tax=Pontibacillus salipaludis TaxID=1697394 RepID=A0ABQ1PZU2_9BACI|nr:hypothetical protein [Pontibacillus salipaludis]GGD08121.1 hypothetical protein GCM10011389_14550 [Pontibacillus salipaludis]